MKLTEQVLKEMISEIYEDLDLGDEQDQGSEEADKKDAEALREPGEVDVRRIADLMTKIDQPQEYIELLTMVLKYGNNIQNKKAVLKALQSQISKFTGTV